MATKDSHNELRRNREGGFLVLDLAQQPKFGRTPLPLGCFRRKHVAYFLYYRHFPEVLRYKESQKHGLTNTEVMGKTCIFIGKEKVLQSLTALVG